MSTINPSTNFPHPVLTKITGKPNYASISTLEMELNANAMSVESTRGGGQYGLLALVVSPAAYVALPNAVQFIAPPNPGPAPVHANQATGPQITETNRQFKAAQEEKASYDNTEASLKKQLIEAVGDDFISIHRDRLLGYALVSTLVLITHIKVKYGKVTEDDLKQNLEDMQKPWDTTTPIETLKARIRDGRAFAEPHDEITAKATLRILTTIMENTGLFADDLKDWRKKAADQKTLVNFWTHFEAADEERLRALNITQAGYNAQGPPAPPPPNNNGQPRPTPEAIGTFLGLYWCHSHGLGRNPNHTSRSCTRQKEGHQVDATIYNMMGGCNLIHRIEGERATPANRAPNNNRRRRPAAPANGDPAAPAANNAEVPADG